MNGKAYKYIDHSGDVIVVGAGGAAYATRNGIGFPHRLHHRLPDPFALLQPRAALLHRCAT